MKININKLLNDYELIDCGKGKKLERFGEITLIRPDITAVTKPQLSISKWRELANAEFIETSKNKGSWKIYSDVPKYWYIKFSLDNLDIKVKLSLTQSKHIGVFPEQFLNWDYIIKTSNKIKNINFLNLFGYTGVSSIVAGKVFNTITHIDSIKKVVLWTKENAQLNNLQNIRCITEDAYKFVTREIKRNNLYQGVILDPPAICSGSNKEKWIFEKDIDNLILSLKQILDKQSFIVMNFYAHSVNDKLIHRIILSYFNDYQIDFNDKVYGESRYGGIINHGYFVRISNV